MRKFVTVIVLATASACQLPTTVSAQQDDTAPPDNNACLQSGGSWTVEAVVATAMSASGYFYLELAEPIAATPVVDVVLDGACLVSWAAGENLPEECVEGAAVTLTGPISIEDSRAGIQVREITCGQPSETAEQNGEAAKPKP